MRETPGRRILTRAIAIGGAFAFAASLWYGVSVHRHAFGARLVWNADAAWPAIAFDVVLFALFALHHSALARPPLKTWIERLVPAGLERATYVWVASALFAGMMAAWRPVPGVVWAVAEPWSRVLAACQIAGILLTADASRQLGVLALAGLRQVGLARADGPPTLRTTGLYRFVRHPIYFAWVLMVWPSPLMTGSRVLFAVVSTVYLMGAVPFEERALRRSFGTAYDAYGRLVRWRMIPGLY